MTTQPLILYDLESRDEHNTCFSPNVWKTRSALNFKKIPYDTKWFEFPDLAPTFKDAGIPANTPSECMFEYSVPTIEFPDGSFIMESSKIAPVLEKLQPSPSLHLDSEYPKRAQAVVDTLLYKLAIGLMYRIPGKLLTPRGAEWYNEERQKITHAPLVDFAGKFDWPGAEVALADLKAMLEENPTGPYILGDVPSYADLIIVSGWELFNRLDEGDVIGRLMAFDPAFQKQWDACKPWFEKKG